MYVVPIGKRYIHIRCHLKHNIAGYFNPIRLDYPSSFIKVSLAGDFNLPKYYLVFYTEVYIEAKTVLT